LLGIARFSIASMEDMIFWWRSVKVFKHDPRLKAVKDVAGRSPKPSSLFQDELSAMAMSKQRHFSERRGLLLCLFLVVYCASPGRAISDLTGGFLNFLTGSGDETIEVEVNKKRLTTSGTKLNLAKECDYDDAAKIVFCPPALNPLTLSNLKAASSDASSSSFKKKILLSRE
jgi:hypothetical protein